MIQDEKKILQEVLVKMFYDPKKTLSEQTSSFIQSPTGRGREGEVYKPVEKEGPSDELIKWREEYPSQCRYPDKVVKHPKSGNLSEEESLIQGFCYYPVASRANKGGITGVWIPSDSEIKFWDVSSLGKVVNDKLKEKEEGKPFWSTIPASSIQKTILSLIQVGTVESFMIGDRKVVLYLSKPTGSFSPDDLSVAGLYYKDTKKSYTQPTVTDTRTTMDFLVDEYGTAAQLATAAVFIAASIATGGLGGLALLATEIAIEGTLGALIAQREWEKGNKVAAGFELLFGLTPGLKGTKLFRGLSKSQVDNIVKKMAEAGLKAESTTDELVTFYRSLKETEQPVFSRMIRDTSDELTESSLKKLMGKQLTEEFYDYAKANPEIFKDLKWFQRVWAKEGAVNGGLLLLNLAYEVLLGTPMSEQEKMEAKGVITTVPEELRIHFLTQILKNSENTQKLRNNGAEIAQKMSQSLSEMGVDVSAARKIAEIELKELAVQDSLDQYGIDYSTKFIETDNKIPEGYIKLTDEELETNLQYVVDIKSINGVNYYLLDKTNLSQ
jgi:hypothetical protein